MKQNKLFLAALLVALFAPISFGSPLTEPQSKAIQKAVADVRVPELAAKAAQLVAQASEKDKEGVALATVEAVISKHPGAAPEVVAAICKVAPATSASVAAAAATLVPYDASEIAIAASKAAPAQAARIAVAVAKVAPRDRFKIAAAVINAVPLASTKVAESLATTFPNDKAKFPLLASSKPARTSALAMNQQGGGAYTKTSPGGFQSKPPGTVPSQGSVTKGGDPARGN